MSDIKIIIAKGSPRRGGNSATLADQVAAGARAAGAEVESFFLHEMDINPCDACDACRTDAFGGCIIEDDMQLLYPRLVDADALVIASPVYWFTVSAQTKLFMDRCYALVDEDGWSLRGKRIGIVMTYGDSDPFNSGAVNAFRTFQDGFNYVGAEIVGYVYGSASDAGEIQRQEKVMTKAFELGQELAAGEQHTSHRSSIS
jgi:multimeric flavodoxin WrbA